MHRRKLEIEDRKEKQKYKSHPIYRFTDGFASFTNIGQKDCLSNFENDRSLSVGVLNNEKLSFLCLSTLAYFSLSTTSLKERSFFSNFQLLVGAFSSHLYQPSDAVASSKNCLIVAHSDSLHSRTPPPELPFPRLWYISSREPGLGFSFTYIPVYSMIRVQNL